MVDMKSLQDGVMGFGVTVVALVLLVVIIDKLQNTSGLGTAAQNVAANGTSLLSSILTDWGAIIVIGLIAIAVLVPLIFVLTRVVGSRGGR